MLARLRKNLGKHEFWTCDQTLTNHSIFHLDLVQGPKQLTDIYLLGLVVEHGGCLVTFDRRIRTSHVTGACDSHLVLI